MENLLGIKHGIPNCIGWIDGNPFPIKRPVLNGDTYFNRKGFYSINGQGKQKLFSLFLVWIFCSWRGVVCFRLEKRVCRFHTFSYSYCCSFDFSDNYHIFHPSLLFYFFLSFRPTLLLSDKSLFILLFSFLQSCNGLLPRIDGGSKSGRPENIVAAYL